MLCEGIIRDPSGALKHSKTETAKFDKMHRICVNRDPTVQRLGIVSLYAVFKDVLPPFRIRVVTEAEMQSQMKKETRARREFEKKHVSCLSAVLEGAGYMRIANPRTRKQQNECWHKAPTHSLNPRSFNVWVFW